MKYPKTYVQSGNVGFPHSEILKDGPYVRRIAQSVIVTHKTKGKRVESITIEEYKRRKQSDSWPEEPKKITLEHEELQKLLNYLIAHKEILKLSTSTTYTLFEGITSLSDLSAEELDKLVQLVRRAAGLGKLKEIMKPELVENLSAALQQARYKESIKQLETMLGNPSLPEDDYKKWFKRHHWVFGTEYAAIENGDKIGWAAKGDIVLRSLDGYQDLVELKLPTANILLEDKSHNNWYPSADLSKAIAQVMKYFQETEDARSMLVTREKLAFLKPRGRIVIGRSETWEQEQFDALRRINDGLHNIQVMTYDQLLARAGQMVQYYEAASSLHTERVGSIPR